MSETVGILHQRLDGAEPEDLVEHLADQALALVEVERDLLRAQELVHDPANRLDDLSRSVLSRLARLSRSSSRR